MKSIYIAIIFVLTSITIYAQNYQLDLKNSAANWKGYGEIGNFSQSGTISFKSGSIVLDDESLVNGEIEINMFSISCEDKKLAKHLKAKDFFDVKKYQTASFKMNKIKNDVVYGILTMKGISQEINFPITFKNKLDKITLTGKAIIDRTKFNIKYNSSSYFQDLGSYAIKNDVDFAFNLVFIK
jgi:polyisoprenoid-binding protein YceI